MPDAPSRRLREVAVVFGRLGLLGFGGPAAHIGLMREEVVVRRGWLDDREFLDHVGATSLIPGPSSTELALFLGRRRAGRLGVAVAGACFILPAVVLSASSPGPTCGTARRKRARICCGE